MTTRRHETHLTETTQPHGPLVKALLRIYASNLHRSYRNSPHAAFVDATIQLNALMALILGSLLMLVEIVASRTFLPSLSLLVGNTKYNRGIVIVVAAVMIIIWLLNRKLLPYEFVPDVEKPYDTARDRIIAWSYYAAGFLLIPLVLIASIYLKRAIPVLQ
jgi:uncharacterized membrane protein